MTGACHENTLFFLTYICTFILPLTVSANDSLPDLFEKVNPAVVDIQSISVQKVTVSETESTSIAVGNDGSGILIDDQGTILTASHVVQTAEKLTVKLLDGRELPASVVSSANWGDIALIKLDQVVDLPVPAILADSDKVRIGEKVFVVGSLFGFSHSLSVGYISSRFQASAMVGTGTMEVFQTDAAMNPGNSGGQIGLQPSTVQAVIGEETLSIGGDIILKIEPMVVTQDPDFFQKFTDYLFNETQAGKSINVEVLREGNVITLSAQ